MRADVTGAILHADPSTVRLGTRGPSTGDLWITLGGAAFPGPRWNDFVVVILGAWCAAVLRIVRSGSTMEEVYFMEGPYSVELSPAEKGELHLRAICRPGGESARAVVSLAAHVTHLLEVAGSTVEAARRLGDIGRDAVRLEHVLAELRAAQVGAGGDTQ
jgi:hypothetical protein